MTQDLSGVGLGVRWEFIEELVTRPPLPLSFLEVSPENYMRRGGYYPALLEALADHYALVTHGLTLSLGSVDPPEPQFLRELQSETERLRTPWHSDHLCISRSGDHVLHDLFPMRRAKSTAQRVADRLRHVEDHLQIPMAVENISYYADLAEHELLEAEFLTQVLHLSGCGLLLDVNNVYVNARNHGFCPREFIRSLPLHSVVELHVAGHAERADGLRVDTHGEDVCEDVYALLEWTVAQLGPVPVLLERDHHVPSLDALLKEVGRVRTHYELGVQKHRKARGAPAQEARA